MGIVRLNHAVLYVRDAERSATFYEQCSASARSTRSPGERSSRRRVDQRPRHRVLRHRSEAGPSGAGRCTVGLYHLAWEVDTLSELAEMAERLTEAGARSVSSDHGASKSLYAHDPDGLEFEVGWIVPADQVDARRSIGVRPLDLSRDRSVRPGHRRRHLTGSVDDPMRDRSLASSSGLTRYGHGGEIGMPAERRPAMGRGRVVGAGCVALLLIVGLSPAGGASSARVTRRSSRRHAEGSGIQGWRGGREHHASGVRNRAPRPGQLHLDGTRPRGLQRAAPVRVRGALRRPGRTSARIQLGRSLPRLQRQRVAGTASCSAAAPTRRVSRRPSPTRSPRGRSSCRTGRRTIAVEVLDQEGLFNVYQERIRAKVARRRLPPRRHLHLRDPRRVGARHARNLRSEPDDVGSRRLLRRLPRERSAKAIEAAYDARVRHASSTRRRSSPPISVSASRRIRSSTIS